MPGRFHTSCNGLGVYGSAETGLVGQLRLLRALVKNGRVGRGSVAEVTGRGSEHLDAADLDDDGPHALDNALVHGSSSVIVRESKLVELEGAQHGLQRKSGQQAGLGAQRPSGHARLTSDSRRPIKLHVL